MVPQPWTKPSDSVSRLVPSLALLPCPNCFPPPRGSQDKPITFPPSFLLPPSFPSLLWLSDASSFFPKCLFILDCDNHSFCMLSLPTQGIHFKNKFSSSWTWNRQISKLSCVAKVIIDFQCQDRNPEGDKLVTTRDSCQNTFLRVAKYESFYFFQNRMEQCW